MKFIVRRNTICLGRDGILPRRIYIWDKETQVKILVVICSSEHSVAFVDGDIILLLFTVFIPTLIFAVPS